MARLIKNSSMAFGNRRTLCLFTVVKVKENAKENANVATQTRYELKREEKVMCRIRVYGGSSKGH